MTVSNKQTLESMSAKHASQLSSLEDQICELSQENQSLECRQTAERDQMLKSTSKAIVYMQQLMIN